MSESRHAYYVALCMTAEHINPIDFPATSAGLDRAIAIEQHIQDEFDALNVNLKPANVSTPAPHK